MSTFRDLGDVSHVPTRSNVAKITKCGRRPGRRVAVAAALVGLAGVGAGLVAARSSAPSLTRARLVAYESAVLVPLREGGATVEQGIKPALADLTERHVTPPAVIAGEADGWVRDLTSVRARVGAVAPPDELREAARLFDRALEQYLEAARTFRAAAAASAVQRRALLDGGYAVARAADATYDDAARVIQRWRHRLGLPSTPDFPDPS